MLTRIIALTVRASDQQRVADVLGLAIEQHGSTRDGFLGATIYTSADKRRVINLAQWRDEASWLAMEADPVMGRAVEGVFELAERSELQTYTTAHTVVASQR